jgi:manganese/zinc/iron transport system substrate-binding protein
MSRFLVLVCAIVLGCGGAPQGDTTGEGMPTVVTTTTIVADLVRQVGGDDVNVVNLMGPGIDPHLYKPSAGDVRRMASADAVFFNGLHLEGKMGEVLEQLDGRGIATVAVASCVPEDRLLVADAASGLPDPHVWFDVELWRYAVECVRDGLVGLDAARADAYRSRAAAYSEELADLHREVVATVEAIPPERRVLVTAHDAFEYFGRAYGFEVQGLLGVSTSSEAGAADVQKLADMITERGIPAVFVETSVSPRYIEALLEAVAARDADVVLGGSLYSDALGDVDGPAGTFVGTVRSNAEVILNALGDSP